MGKLDGKIALITGGSQGMGFDTAKEFLKEGAFVFITGRRRAELDRAVAELGPGAAGIQADAGKLADLDRMYAEIKEQKGRLDIVFANAGVYEQKPCQEVTEEFYDDCADINAKGVFLLFRRPFPDEQYGLRHPDWVFYRECGLPRHGRVRSDQGGCAQFRPQLHCGTEGQGTQSQCA